jgi:hypothetical protein
MNNNEVWPSADICCSHVILTEQHTSTCGISRAWGVLIQGMSLVSHYHVSVPVNVGNSYIIEC